MQKKKLSGFRWVFFIWSQSN